MGVRELASPCRLRIPRHHSLGWLQGWDGPYWAGNHLQPHELVEHQHLIALVEVRRGAVISRYAVHVVAEAGNALGQLPGRDVGSHAAVKQVPWRNAIAGQFREVDRVCAAQADIDRSVRVSGDGLFHHPGLDTKDRSQDAVVDAMQPGRRCYAAIRLLRRPRCLRCCPGRVFGQQFRGGLGVRDRGRSRENDDAKETSIACKGEGQEVAHLF